MSNPNKAKGTRAESRVVKYLKDHGIEATRKALSGSKDEGDIEIKVDGLDIILEVKTGKMTNNYSRSQLDEWLRQTEVEGKNSDSISYLVIVRYNRKISDAEVYMISPFDWRCMLYLDEFVKRLDRFAKKKKKIGRRSTNG